MRRLVAFVAIAVGVGSGSPAGAATLSFQGSLVVTVGSGVFGIPGSGIATVETTGTHLESLALPAFAFATAGLSLPLGDPTLDPLRGLQITAHNGSGSFAPGGAMPLPGVAKVCLFKSCGAGPPANLSVPLSVIGAGGTAVASGAVDLTVVGAPWAESAVVGSSTARGFAHGPASATSTTAQASGVRQLVTPILISTSLEGAALIPAFGVLTLHFVPEPATALLVALALAGVAVRLQTLRRS